MAEPMPSMEEDIGLDRPYQPPPGPWQAGVIVKHKADGRNGRARCVDHNTRQFRLVGGSRTQWESFEEWDPVVEPSIEDLARKAAIGEWDVEMMKLSPEQQAIVSVLADDADPIKALAKLKALRNLGAIATPKRKTAETTHE